MVYPPRRHLTLVKFLLQIQYLSYYLSCLHQTSKDGVSEPTDLDGASSDLTGLNLRHRFLMLKKRLLAQVPFDGHIKVITLPIFTKLA